MKSELPNSILQFAINASIDTLATNVNQRGGVRGEIQSVSYVEEEKLYIIFSIIVM